MNLHAPTVKRPPALGAVARLFGLFSLIGSHGANCLFFSLARKP